MSRDRGPGPATAPPRDPGEALLGELRRLLAGVDPVPAPTLDAARLAFAQLLRATTVHPPLTRRQRRARAACAHARRRS